MGDHRATIKLSFSIHGKTYRHCFDWINYFPTQEGIDERIVGWFSDCWEDAYSRYQKQVDKIMAEQNKERIEKEERAELERLKEKYE